jgi:hypothetical protein
MTVITTISQAPLRSYSKPIEEYEGIAFQLQELQKTKKHRMREKR